MDQKDPKAQYGKISWWTAAGIVVANMIGTGVFTSLGFQLEAVRSSWSIIALWTIGGVLSLIGAFVYAELGTHFRKSGGDYVFLSETFHPLLGYLYAWTSLTVGFSAPIAIAAMAMVYYLKPFLSVDAGTFFGILLILVVSIFHSLSLRRSSGFHAVLTIFKVVFAVALVITGFLYPPEKDPSLDFTSPWLEELFLPGFAVSLIYVSYAYTGWNSAAYITEEIRSPQKDLPLALVAGTVFVSLIYVLLQLVFLKHARTGELEGQVDVALIAFGDLNGSNVVHWISLFISLQLISTISGYVWIGPRITFAMARDFRLWKGLSSVNRNGIPVRALWFNSGISILLVLTGSFEQVLLYASFVLQLMGTLTIASSLKIKVREGNFRSPFKPLIQVVYILFSTWILLYTLFEKPFESLVGLGIMGAGAILYQFDKRY
jgi:basic amino acid/polyamine antiporter, APA family